jgi:AcrR family transcriptional regulator
MSTPRNQQGHEPEPEQGDESGRAGAAPKRRGRPPKPVVEPDRPGLGRESPTADLPATARSILAAARRVLAERGLEGLTIEAVANEAQVGRKLIPYHFGSRAGLVTILFDSLFHDLAVGFYNRRAAGPRGSLPDFLDWIRQEAEDESAQRDFFELIVVALREPELRRRIAALYDEYGDLTLELAGVSQDGEADAERRRHVDAVGSVLMAIGDGIGLHSALDPDFDLEGTIAAVEFLIGGAMEQLARVEGDREQRGADGT